MSDDNGGHPPRARILLVEDEPALVLTLTDRLRAERYEVDVVSEGEVALASLGRVSYDLVLLTPVFIWAYTVRNRWLAVGIMAVSAVASRSLDWGIKLHFRPLAAAFSLAIAAACVVAWYRDNRARVAPQAARAAA